MKGIHSGRRFDCRMHPGGREQPRRLIPVGSGFPFNRLGRLEVQCLTIQKSDDGAGERDELTAAHNPQLGIARESR
jgi:hypothetical protein